jgi:hypothetical protein
MKRSEFVAAINKTATAVNITVDNCVLRWRLETGCEVIPYSIIAL